MGLARFEGIVWDGCGGLGLVVHPGVAWGCRLDGVGS